jgi:hypothetical protein
VLHALDARLWAAGERSARAELAGCATIAGTAYEQLLERGLLRLVSSEAFAINLFDDGFSGRAAGSVVSEIPARPLAEVGVIWPTGSLSRSSTH